jgi:hypothetical protein
MKHLGKVRTKSIQEVAPEWNDIQKKSQEESVCIGIFLGF